MLRLLTLALFLLVSLVLVSLAAEADEGDWYISPSIGYTDDDPDRKIDDSFSGGQIQLGREMSDHFWLEGLLGYHDVDGFPGQEHLELGFNAIGNFLPDSRFSPYVIGGLGYLRANVGEPDFGGLPPAGSTASNMTATGGLGLKVRFGDSPWSLRAEWRLRHAFDSDNSLTDQVGSLGLQYSFGGGSGPALMAAASEPEADSDGDGVSDAWDACPNTPAGTAVDSEGCPADSDRDGVSDDRDQCPGTVAGAKVDSNGCEIVELTNIYFGFDSDVVLETSRHMLDKTASTLSRNPDLQVEIAGYADSRGPEKYNMGLSLRRAEAVREYLEQAGVNPARLTVRGYGESHKDASSLTAKGMAENRRVELRALDR
ncbi:MAG: OmpA family protein [Woeseiaceae bacterium]|nr:OmpA family protein [Woeseiaceae bacterium]